ncbi:glucose-1-phosphate cytidylyltransferase [Devosia sp. J2-20]|uniref:glucose-1-phosphate cytidylyltransferase n=1 Tax=unclassified Devosia TaxID=196773 RepID=UPI00249C1AE7|nr:glucose-1-phosphate cytidylyltransferase [Devosia sp. J2-20]WDR00473.1 glucose-1-phosphate cytidylyltransferase [Devosia sp. J2-20]
MKVLILAGGYGTRLGEETAQIPKPMVTVGGRPILWHIMKLYASQGFNEFVILLGYKGYVIKEYFMNYFLHQNDVTIDLANNEVLFHNQHEEDWKVTLLDTGESTMTGGRVLRAKDFIGNEPFMLTYGDGVSNINLNELLSFHQAHGKTATMSAVQPDGRFGTFEDEDGLVTKFVEKPRGDEAWINGGFFVFEPQIFDHISEGDRSVLEDGALQSLANSRELVIRKHHGYWKCMDTLKDKLVLDELWNNGSPPWKLW